MFPTRAVPVCARSKAAVFGDTRAFFCWRTLRRRWKFLNSPSVPYAYGKKHFPGARL
jgi:hypothetical protein